MTTRFQFACCALLLLLSATIGHAQIRNSGAKTITLNALLIDSLGVNVSTHAVSFNLTSGSTTNPGSTAVVAQTAWISRAGRTLSLYAYFSSSTAALTDGFGNNIPTADFSISDNGGAYTPLTTTAAYGGANAGMQLYTVKITGTNKTGNHTDNMLFNINLSTIPLLPAGTYTGTLNIQAQII